MMAAMMGQMAGMMGHDGGMSGKGPGQDGSSWQVQGADRSSPRQNKREELDMPRTGKKFMCTHFEKDGVCKFGRRCNYAHGSDELLETPKAVGSKYAFCKDFPKGTCRFGDWCHFAHSKEELSDEVVGLEAFVEENNLDQTVHNKLFDLPKWILKMVMEKGSLKLNSNPSAACMMRIKESLLESELKPQDHLKPEDRQSLKGANKGAIAQLMKGSNSKGGKCTKGADQKAVGKDKAMGHGKGKPPREGEASDEVALYSEYMAALYGAASLPPSSQQTDSGTSVIGMDLLSLNAASTDAIVDPQAWYAAFQASVAQAEEPAAKRGRTGDWICAECGDHQFARNYTCRNCGVMKPHQAAD